MTIAIGMHCQDGIVIAADSQISAPDHHKYFESKVSYTDGPDWALMFGYSGDPGLHKEARDKIMRTLPREGFSPIQAYEACDKVFSEFGRHYSPVDLQMFIGVSVRSFRPGLIVFSGQGLHWEDGIKFLGIGDSSLMKYLSDALYEKSISVEQGQKLAVYMVTKAKQCIDHCGGPTTVYSLLPVGKEWGLLPETIVSLEKEMEGKEQACLKQILDF
jgi:20S proteasome alpha/beta subunit